MSVTTVTDRGMTYSAEAAGNAGFLRCHVVRRQLVDGRTQYTVVVCNETTADALAEAFVPDLAGDRKRTIVQTIVGSQSDFSTSIILDLVPPGVSPEVHVVLTGGDIHFTLAVPPAPVEFTVAGATPDEALVRRIAPGAAIRPVAVPAHTTYTPDPPVIATLHTARSRAIEPGRSRPQALPPVTPIVLGFTALLTLSGLFVFRPQISELGAPPQIEPAEAVAIRYHATGLGNAEYTVLDPNGQTVAAGPLALGDGVFEVRLPRARAATAYLVRVRVSNPLVSAQAEEYLHVAGLPPAPAAPAPRHAATRAPAPLAPPQIRSVALDRATLASGETLNVYYDVLAASGTIALIDPATQITYARAAVSDSGHAALAAPRVDVEKSLAVVLSATRGTATVQSRVGVTVTPLDATAPDAAPAAGAPGDGAPPVDPDKAAVAEPADISPSATSISAPPSVRARQPVRVEIRGAAAGLQLRLLDDTGSEIARREIRAGESIADFTAPDVHVATRCVFEATYPRGAGAETVIRTITVLP